MKINLNKKKIPNNGSWFAWYPVKTEDGWLVWMDWVTRVWNYEKFYPWRPPQSRYGGWDYYKA